MTQNAILPGDDVAERIAARTMAKRGAAYPVEVRRLLDAALEVIGGHGRSSRPRVADIVAAAGLSNDAFYRHFPSKDALIAALLEDGTERLVGYTAHAMGKETEPAA
ncbi:MAG TPA: helix-turn-helix domain-containing protein, partial [Acidimicrobiales bacterium]|nr:helix-turn-helix domain-containing protein [Acidimicrobiales bacterium]